MPHRPDSQGASASLSPGVGATNHSSVYTPPRVAGSTAAAIMRQQSRDGSLGQVPGITSGLGLSYGGHPSGIVTPFASSKGGGPTWLAAGSRNKSSDSTDRSTATTATTMDETRSIATLATEDEREATASALLMVAKAAEREHQQSYLKGMVVESSNSNNSSSSSSGRAPGTTTPGLSSVPSSVSRGSPSTVPLKKRKKQLRDDACHVSPMSHASTDRGTATASAATNSYDSKDTAPPVLTTPKGEMTQELLDSSKVHSTAQIGNPRLQPARVPLSHFPTLLHRILADSDEEGSAMRWLPDGEAWKVNNWNAMRREILPRYFSDLPDEDGRSCGTIDAFLHHVDAWGFEETSAGAYRHNLFIRGAQKLCVKMRFTADARSDGATNGQRPNTVSPGRHGADVTERRMLQVPMLASAGTTDPKKQPVLHPGKRPRYESDAAGQPGHAPLHWPFSGDAKTGAMWGANGQFGEGPHARAYGMRAAAALSAGTTSFATLNGTYNIDPRMQLSRIPTSDSGTVSRPQPHLSFQYIPPQVRSGRGALRGIAPSAQPNQGSSPAAAASPTFRHGFPVSNRGKGRRKTAFCRTPLAGPATENPTASTSEAPKATTASAGMNIVGEAQRVGTSVQGVAMAISRKGKRKLPMAGARKAETGSNSALASAEQTGTAQ